MLTFTFTEGASTKPFETFVEAEMDKSIKHFEKELLKIRTGRAHTSTIEDIKVSAYGALMPLKELAALSAPDSQMLVVQPWDKSIMADIEKAISTSDLGIAPVVDGDLIRIQLPKMSTARREELAKVLSQRLEESKVSVRNVRKDILNLLRDTEKSKKISEDYSKRLQDLLQKITDKMTEISEKMAQKKHAELMSV
jgi:ribosome recycling factor